MEKRRKELFILIHHLTGERIHFKFFQWVYALLVLNLSLKVPLFQFSNLRFSRASCILELKIFIFLKTLKTTSDTCLHQLQSYHKFPLHLKSMQYSAMTFIKTITFCKPQAYTYLKYCTQAIESCVDFKDTSKISWILSKINARKLFQHKSLKIEWSEPFLTELGSFTEFGKL